jgi:hypothetical protein
MCDAIFHLLIAVSRTHALLACISQPPISALPNQTQQDATRANKRQRLEAPPQQPLLTAAVPAAPMHLLDTTGIAASLECVHEGYARQYPNGMLVFQLRGLHEEYKSLQGTARYTPGLTLRLTLAALVQRGLVLAFNAQRSTVVWSIAGNTTQQLVFTVELISLDSTTGECELQLTATPESYMLLATAIRQRQCKKLKQGTAVFTIDFGAVSVLQFAVPFIWRSLALCKQMPEGVYSLTL